MPPTSTAIPSPQDWADASMLVPHEVFRRWMQELAAVRLRDAKSAATFRRWWHRVFVPSLHHHHEMEEAVYFPWIQKKAQVPPKLTKDHGGLVRQLDETTAAVDKAAKTGAAVDLELCATLIAALCKDLAEHLAEEEQLVPPLLREHFTKEEEAKIVDKIVKKGGLAGGRDFLPGIIDAMEAAGGYGPVTAKSFTATLPPPLRFAHKHWLAARYQKKIIGVLRSLR